MKKMNKGIKKEKNKIKLEQKLGFNFATLNNFNSLFLLQVQERQKYKIKKSQNNWKNKIYILPKQNQKDNIDNNIQKKPITIKVSTLLKLGRLLIIELKKVKIKSKKRKKQKKRK